MVQPTMMQEDEKTVKILSVHDVVLEFIVSQAGKDNFVTVRNGKDSSGNYSTKFRRLSIQTNISEAEEISKVVNNVSHLRSVNIFRSDLELGKHAPDFLDLELGKHAPDFLNSQLLRVMLVPSWCMIQDCHLRHARSFSQLKYLKITKGEELPEQIGMLRNLETLDLKQMSIEKLPASIVQLQKLVHLLVWRTSLPNGIGNLHALEVLYGVSLNNISAEWIQELGDLTKLRELEVFWDIPSTTVGVDRHVKVFLSSLSKLLVSLKKLCVWDINPLVSDSDLTFALTALQGSTLPLQSLHFPNTFPNTFFHTVPNGISSLVNLTSLKINILGEVSKEGLNILASLPMLLFLQIRLKNSSSGLSCSDQHVFYPRHAIGLMKFDFRCYHEWALEFESGAMPRLQKLRLDLVACYQFKHGQGGVLGLQNLSCLKHVTVHVLCFRAVITEVEALEDDIRSAAGSHPNRPILEVKRLEI